MLKNSQENILFFCILWLLCAKCYNCKGGKSATKAGLAGITQVNLSSSGSASAATRNNANTQRTHTGHMHHQNAQKRLKYDLLIGNDYDKGVRPVKNHSHSVLIEIDITYMQVLNLNEKDQILRSLLRYRLYWKDEFLVWDPNDYDGITDIALPAHAIWLPDIVCYEDTGARSFEPRIPFVEVNHEGALKYLEPTDYETTCPVNIENFPFDTQICTFTFVSWSQPTSHLDLMSRRRTEEMRGDIKTYFSHTGEWKMNNIEVVKRSESFETIFVQTEEERHDHESFDTFVENDVDHMQKETPSFQENDIEESSGNKSNNPEKEDHYQNKKEAKTEGKQERIVLMDPRHPVRDVYATRVSQLHWSDVKFTIEFQRNSSLFVQSMIFPALLLTLISILGFYLPPDSGERVGLQVTILLTFMVFILTVGDMFPASSGPYLGIYFVLCMALLGLNILMTILVLHLHHMPCNATMKSEPKAGLIRVNFKALPLWIRINLSLFGLIKRLKEYAVTENGKDIEEVVKALPKENQIMGSARKKFQSFTRALTKSSVIHGNSDTTLHPGPNVISFTDSRSPGDNPAFVGDYMYLENKRITRSVLQEPPNSTKNNDETKDFCKMRHSDTAQATDKHQQITKEHMQGYDNIQMFKCNAFKALEGNISKLATNISDISTLVSVYNSSWKETKASEAMEDMWRDVARVVDIRCMYTYVIILLVIHIVIVSIVSNNVL